MKRLLYISACAVLAFSLIGCSNSAGKQNDGDPKTEDSKQVIDDVQKYADEISDYLPSDSKYRLYNGYAEAGFEVKFKEKTNDNDNIVYKYIGAMCDGMGADGEKRTFDVTYTIGNGSVVEHVENNDPFASSAENVYSIIPNFIVLDGEIKENNSWEQSVEIKGQTFVGKTTIISVSDNSFTTRTEIPLEGYKDGVYTEERTYTMGKGITGFNNTPYGSDKDDTLIFGYGYSTENDSSVTGEIK